MGTLAYRDYMAKGGAAWSVHCLDSDVDTTAELITETDLTHTSLNTADTIEIVSSSGADTTQTVTVYGINSDGKKASETFELNGATQAVGSTTFAYFDYAKVDAECAGTITIREASANATIQTITIGQKRTYAVQHFNGENVSYLTSWSGGVNTATGDVTLELRLYTDDDDCMDPTDGFEVLDRMFLHQAATDNRASVPFQRSFDPALKIPAGSWVCVYGTGSQNNSDAYVTLQGWDDAD